MCIAIPSKITAIDDMTADIDVQGAQRQVSLMILSYLNKKKFPPDVVKSTAGADAVQKEIYFLIRFQGKWLIDDLQVIKEDVKTIGKEI